MGEGISEGSKGEKRCEELGVKFCEGSKVLPYLEANKLDCHSFMDAGRRQEISGSETKAFVTCCTSGSLRIMSLWVCLVVPYLRSSRGDMEGSRVIT